MCGAVGQRRLRRRGAARLLTHTCYPQMAHEIFNEPERELPMTELTRWLATLPCRDGAGHSAGDLE